MMKRILSLLLCLMMVLGFAAPSVQASSTGSASASNSVLDNVYIQDGSGCSVVINGEDVTDQVNNKEQSVKLPSPTDLVPQPPVSAPVAQEVCQCTDLASAVAHGGICQAKVPYMQACEASAEELFTQWGSYTSEEQAYMLAYLYDTFPLKHSDLEKLLNAPTGSASETLTDGTTVSVEGIPQDGSLTVEETTNEVNDIVDAYVAQKTDSASTELFSYDVSVQDGEGSDWQPETSVKMELELPGEKLHKYTKVYVVHVDDEGNATTIEAQVTEDGKIAFETPGFSTFAGFTVDFSYEGIQFSIPGLSSITLSELFDNLKMPLNAEDVVNVEYTDYSQLKIEQLEGDWLLTSLKAFDTEEKLTLTMADGTVYNIKVTDKITTDRASCYFAARDGYGTSEEDIDMASNTGDNGVSTVILTNKTYYYQYDDKTHYIPESMAGLASGNIRYFFAQPLVFNGHDNDGAFEIVFEKGSGTSEINVFYVDIWQWYITNGAIVNVSFEGFDDDDTIIFRQVWYADDWDSDIVPMFTIEDGSLYFNVTDSSLFPDSVETFHASTNEVDIVFDHCNNSKDNGDATIFMDDGDYEAVNDVPVSGEENLYINNVTFRNSSRRALFCQSNQADTIRLDNCIFEDTIKSDLAGGGGAIYISYQISGTAKSQVNVDHFYLNNCTFQGNSATIKGGGARGGAILVWGNLYDTKFYNCTFNGCDPDAQGGAVSIGNQGRDFNMETITFEECKFYNMASGDSLAGAVLIAQKSTNITFKNCIFGDDENEIVAQSHGGAIHIGGTGDVRVPVNSLTVTGCTFKNCKAKGNIGGALRLVTGGGSTVSTTAVTISGNTFTNCSAADSGGAVALDCVKLGTVQLLNNTFTGNSSGNHGGAVFIGCSYADDAITAGAMTKGTGVTVGAVTVEGCSFTSNQASSLGGGLCITDGTYTSVTMKTTIFDQCRTRGFGGGFAMKSVSEAAKATTPVTVTDDVKITACKFTYCHSGRVEPVYTDDAETIPNYWDHDNDPSTDNVMEINGGFGGGGIALGGTYKGIVEIKGESKDKPMLFQNCTTWNSGGAITFNQDMTIYGRTVTDSTTNTTKEVGLTLQFLNIDKCFARDAGNGIYFNTVAFDPVLIADCTIQNCDYFNPNNKDFTAVAAADKNDVLNTRYFVTPNGYTTDKKTEWLKEWQTDKVYITSDSSGTIRTVGTSSINAVMDGCTFNNNGSYTSGGAIYWNANNKTDTVTPQLIVRGSTFTGNRARYHGGGLYCEAAVMVQGCEFKENTAGYCGGGIAQNMYSWYGRDIVAGENNNLNLTAGSDGKNTMIHNNTAKNGGGIGIILGETLSLKGKPDFLYPVEFTLGGASVYDNTASENGGGIYYYVTKYDNDPALQQEVDCYDKKINLNNGYVYNNKAQNGNGGGIYMNSNQVNLPEKDANDNYTKRYGSSTVTISNASVYSNKAYAGNGGGIYLTGENAVCEVTGGAVGALLTKENNKDVLTAGANYAYNHLEDGEAVIEGTGNGGGIAIVGAGMELSNGYIENNIASANGGGIYCSTATYEMTGGMVKTNQAVNGGGLFITGRPETLAANADSVTIYGGEISSNTASERGGGVSAEDYAKVLMSSSGENNNKTYPKIDSNTAARGGGIAVLSAAKLTVNEGYITHNKATGTINYDTAYHVGDTVTVTVKDENDQETTEIVSVKGIGGGIWVADGVDADHKSTFKLQGQVVAIYGNLADLAADDVYSNANHTELDIRTVEDMDLADYDIGPEGWVEDYVDEDTNYWENTDALKMLVENQAPTGTIVQRYRKATSSQRYMLINANYVEDRVNAANAYVCMTLGIPTAFADTVVVDYGKDALISIWKNDLFLYNDNLKNDFAIPTDSKALDTGSYLLPSLPASGITKTNESYYSQITKGKGPTDDCVRDKLEKTYGTVTNDGTGVLKYSLKNMNMTGEDVFYYAVAHSNGVFQYWYYGEVTVIPATTLYFEDNSSSVTYHEGDQLVKWETVGAEGNVSQDEDRPGPSSLLEGLDANNIYGFDSSYANTEAYSNGGAHWVKATRHSPVDENNDGICDVDNCVKKVRHTWTDSNKDGACDVCRVEGTHHCVDTNNDHKCDSCDKVVDHTCVDSNTNYLCDICGGVYKHPWRDTDCDGKCNLCNDKHHQCVDLDYDDECDTCERYFRHTCVDNKAAKNYCDICGQSMGTHTMSGRATFTFTGTGFDIISLCDNTTGLIMASVYRGTTTERDKLVASYMVDTYYSLEDTLYQVPAIKADLTKVVTVMDNPNTEDVDETVTEDKGYGTYTVELTIAPSFLPSEHGYNETYFYLDAIRIYNPAGRFDNQGDNDKLSDTVKDAYKTDGEAWPEYVELRNLLLKQENLNAGNSDATGIIFIDGKGSTNVIEDYKSWGPNNEVYLQPGDSIAFLLDQDSCINLAGIHLGMRGLTGQGSVLVRTIDDQGKLSTLIKSAISTTDMYYDIGQQSSTGEFNTPGKVVIIKNHQNKIDKNGNFVVENGLHVENTVPLAISNIKITHTSASATEPANYFRMSRPISDIVLNVLNAEELAESPVVTPKRPALSFNGMVCYNVFFSAENLGDLTAEDLGLAVFSTEDTEGTVETAREVIYGATEIDGLYMASTGGVHAKNLGDRQYFRAFAKKADGTIVYSKMVSYSAVDYAMNVLAKSTSDVKLKQLVVAMLNYGAEAQKFFGYNTDNLMTKDLTADDLALLNGFDASALNGALKVDASKVGSFASNGGFSQRKPAISFKGAFEINYFFTPSNAVDGDMKLYFWNEDTYNSVSQLTAENADKVVTMTEDNGTYTACSDEIAAKYLDKTVFVAAVYESNGTTYCSGVLPYSIATYCQNPPATVQDLAAAAAIYGCTAKQYFVV